MRRKRRFKGAGKARQQAPRGTSDPENLHVTIGKLMSRQLRQEWTTSHGGRAGWKAFHDQFLSYGGPPIPLVRAQMLGEPHGKRGLADPDGSFDHEVPYFFEHLIGLVSVKVGGAGARCGGPRVR